MRSAVLFLLCRVVLGQVPDAAYEPLSHAYESLRAMDYDNAVAGFRKALEAAPQRAAIHKDLAYTYLKIGENEMARDEFREAMQLEPDDIRVAMEYAFLCYETKEQAQARRIFDRVRKTGNAIAEKAFQNIDGPLGEGIARWQEALARGGESFSAHYELATMAEQRDEMELAAEHYEKAWRMRPDRRTVLVDWGRALQELNQTEEANAVLLTASRGGEPRAAEMAQELLPARYPYVLEFRRALELDPDNIELRRELGFLLLRMDREPEAEVEFRILTRTAPGDFLSVTQLGFLLLARGDVTGAMPLFERVLAGPDRDLANRVRAVLRIEQAEAPRTESQPAAVEAKVMAERSIKAGYLKDAINYLQIAHEDEPGDFGLMLKLGWTYNMLHDDGKAVRWFDLARRSTDPEIAEEARGAWRNLRGTNERFRTSAWLYPLFSTRWRDLFSYGQVKTELRTGSRVRPYLSTRFVGDTRVTMTMGSASPEYLSESSFILGVGVASEPWHGIVGWAEAGTAISYLKGHMLPDYRGGGSLSRAWGTSLIAKSSGWFGGSNTDGVFVSRFGKDFLIYEQARFGWSRGPESLRTQFYWNANLTMDVKRQGWANFMETGPGIRVRAAVMPPSMYVALDFMRGVYLIHGSYAVPNFSDIRTGIWYAFTH